MAPSKSISPRTMPAIKEKFSRTNCSACWRYSTALSASVKALAWALDGTLKLKPKVRAVAAIAARGVLKLNDMRNLMSFSFKTPLAAIAATALTLGLSLSVPSNAHASAFTDADKAVEYRQQALQLVRENFSFMAGMVRGEIDFDGAMFEQRAKALAHLSH